MAAVPGLPATASMQAPPKAIPLCAGPPNAHGFVRLAHGKVWTFAGRAKLAGKSLRPVVACPPSTLASLRLPFSQSTTVNTLAVHTGDDYYDFSSNFPAESWLARQGSSGAGTPAAVGG
jgi:hypothetical protein